MSYEIEVNIRGIFGNQFIKESFALEIRKETHLDHVFKLIDKKLKIKLFNKLEGKFPPGWLILLNGDRIDSPSDRIIPVRHQDQLSVLSALGGG
jgi:hypothetical protein